MEIKLPADVLDELPAPDSEGLVRVSVAIKVGAKGDKARIVEINDVPVGGDDDYDMPSPDDVATTITSQ